ncbi:MAG TPA: patatin-like phospholipase family protein [Nitrososphaeraceae archaeon]
MNKQRTSISNTMTTGNDKPPIPQRAIIFQGGGALGAYEAGVFEVLYNKLRKQDSEKAQEDKRYKDRPLFDIVAGTSIGAINAAILVNYVLDKRRANKNLKISECWEGSANTLSQFWNEFNVSNIAWWHPKTLIDNWFLRNPFFYGLWNYSNKASEIWTESYKLFSETAKVAGSSLALSLGYRSLILPIFSLNEGWPYWKFIDIIKEDWREQWPYIFAYYIWPDNYSPTASAESARRYYSYWSSMFFGSPKVLTPSTVPLPAAILQPDSKFYDILQFTINSFFRFNNTPLEKTIMRYWNYEKHPKIKTDSQDHEPRLLVVAADALDCTTAVTFDSYKYKGKDCELCYSEGKFDQKIDNTEEYIEHLKELHKDQVQKLQHAEEGNSIWKSVYGGEQNTHTVFYDGVELNHIRASMSIHQRYKYPEIDVLTAKNKKEEPRIFWDGAYLSNTPLREVIQAHQNYWKEIGDGKTIIPDIEVYIVNLYPTTEKNFSSDADTIKDREVDISFHDRTSYDIKVAEMTTDYINLSRQLQELVNEAKSKIRDSKDKDTIDTKLKNLLSAETKSRRRNGKRRLYKELIEKRFEINKVVYIERSDDGNTIFGKSFDFSSFTIQQLKQRGIYDAEIQMELKSIDEEIKDWLSNGKNKKNNHDYRDILEQLLQEIKLSVKHEDVDRISVKADRMIRLIDEAEGPKSIIDKINQFVVTTKQLENKTKIDSLPSF